MLDLSKLWPQDSTCKRRSEEGGQRERCFVPSSSSPCENLEAKDPAQKHKQRMTLRKGEPRDSARVILHAKYPPLVRLLNILIDSRSLLIVLHIIIPNIYESMDCRRLITISRAPTLTTNTLYFAGNERPMRLEPLKVCCPFELVNEHSK